MTQRNELSSYTRLRFGKFSGKCEKGQKYSPFGLGRARRGVGQKTLLGEEIIKK